MQTRYNGTNILYTDEELSKTAIQIKEFLGELNNMIIYENDIPRIFIEFTLFFIRHLINFFLNR